MKRLCLSLTVYYQRISSNTQTECQDFSDPYIRKDKACYMHFKQPYNRLYSQSVSCTKQHRTEFINHTRRHLVQIKINNNKLSQTHHISHDPKMERQWYGPTHITNRFSSAWLRTSLSFSASHSR